MNTQSLAFKVTHLKMSLANYRPFGSSMQLYLLIYLRGIQVRKLHAYILNESLGSTGWFQFSLGTYCNHLIQLTMIYGPLNKKNIAGKRVFSNYACKQQPLYTMWFTRLSWWRHQMETFFRITGPLCGEFPGPGEFPTQRPVTRSFDVFFDLRLDKRLS